MILRTTYHNKSRKQGFTIIELMIVVIIIAILTAIGVPMYDNIITKSRRSNAQGTLLSFAAAMERYYTSNNSYLGAATNSDNNGKPRIFPTQAPIDGNEKYYDLTIEESTTTTFTLQATPINSQEGDGYMQLTSIGLKIWDENDNDSIDSDERDWE